jgi:periodic tryptophan protein 2
MKSNFKFSNLLGSVYTRGNLVFSNDGNSLVSPVGNRVTIYDLFKNKSFTLEHETLENIELIQLNHQNTLLILVDGKGRAILINFKTKVLLARINFKGIVSDVQFSPDDKSIAVAVGNKVQLWHTPGYKREFQPFVLDKTIGGHYDDITSITWKNDSKQFLTTSRDMTTRLHSLDTEQRVLLTGHSDIVLGAYFYKDSIYTVSRDGALYEYTYESSEQVNSDPLTHKKPKNDSKNPNERALKLKTARREYFNQNQKIVSCAFHGKSGLLSVGFDGGVFGIWELPEFVNVQSLRFNLN